MADPDRFILPPSTGGDDYLSRAYPVRKALTNPGGILDPAVMMKYAKLEGREPGRELQAAPDSWGGV